MMTFDEFMNNHWLHAAIVGVGGYYLTGDMRLSVITSLAAGAYMKTYGHVLRYHIKREARRLVHVDEGCKAVNW